MFENHPLVIFANAAAAARVALYQGTGASKPEHYELPIMSLKVLLKQVESELREFEFQRDSCLERQSVSRCVP